MEKNTIILVSFILINLLILAIGSIEPMRKLKIQQLEETVVALELQIEETNIVHEEEIREMRSAHANSVASYNQRIRENEELISELEDQISGNDMLSVGENDFKLLYEYYFLMGLYFNNEINRISGALSSDNSYYNAIVQPRSIDARTLRSYLERNDKSQFLRIFETRLNLPRRQEFPGNLSGIEGANRVVRINPMLPTENRYILEYIEDWVSVSNKFRELDIPYSTGIIDALLNNHVIRGGGLLSDEISLFIPNRMGNIYQFSQNKDIYDFDYDEYWQESLPILTNY